MELNEEEMKAIRALAEKAAAHCGAGEDVMGAILYTSGRKHLNDEQCVELARKIGSAGEPKGLSGEEFYDAEVAPVLARLANECNARKMPFAAWVGINPSKEAELFSCTMYWPKGAWHDPGRRVLIEHAMKGSSLDGLVYGFADYVKESKTRHTSLALKCVGVEPEVEDRQ